MGNDLTRRLQPAQGTTAILFVGTISALAFLLPDNSKSAHFASFVHLSSISTWFGIQFWVTFVAGLTKLKLLPRHYFGLVQSHLFPKAFLYGTCLSCISLGSFAVKYPMASWQSDENMQVLALSTNLVSTIINYLVVAPKMNTYMLQQHKLEKEFGHGYEIGPITDKQMLERPQYKELRRKFFIYHGMSTTLNLLAFVSNGIFFWFLSKKL